MTTYRKFDRFRSNFAFITDTLNFIEETANKLIGTGVGTPASAYAAGGGFNLVTSAAANDTAVVQRGAEAAATAIAKVPFAKGKKVSAVGRFEHANFTGINLNFGLAPVNAAPFGLNTGAFMTLNADGSYTCKFGSQTVTGQLEKGTLALNRDKYGGIDVEVYHDGAGKVGFFVGGLRIGGFDVTYDANGAAQGGVAALLSLSAGIVSTTATAKTVNFRRAGTAHQVAGHYPQ